MTEKEALLGFAARLDQFYLEVEVWAKQKTTGFFAGHEAMVALASVRNASQYLIRTAKRFE